MKLKNKITSFLFGNKKKNQPIPYVLTTSDKALCAKYKKVYKQYYSLTDIAQHLQISTQKLKRLVSFYRLPTHLKRWQAMKKLGLKRCYKCQDYYKIPVYQKDSYNVEPFLDGKQRRCRTCQNKLMRQRYHAAKAIQKLFAGNEYN